MSLFYVTLQCWCIADCLNWCWRSATTCLFTESITCTGRFSWCQLCEVGNIIIFWLQWSTARWSISGGYNQLWNWYSLLTVYYKVPYWWLTPGIYVYDEFVMSANSRIRFGLRIVFVCLYVTPSQYHICANLSEDIELIKCLSDIFCQVCE